MEATKETKFGTKDDARTLSTCIVQRKHTIPHSTMKNNCNIIECCNNTHRVRHVPANKCVLVLRTSVKLVMLFVVTPMTEKEFQARL